MARFKKTPAIGAHYTEFDPIHANDHHALEHPHSKVKMIEIEFKRLMFDVRDA